MSNNTINKEEVEKFNKIAEEWWNPHGKFKPLHKFNPIRIEYIKNNIITDFNISSKRCQIGFSPLCGCSAVIAGQSGTSLGRRNKNGVVRACLLFSSAPTFPNGEIQC